MVQWCQCIRAVSHTVLTQHSVKQELSFMRLLKRDLLCAVLMQMPCVLPALSTVLCEMSQKRFTFLNAYTGIIYPNPQPRL